MSPLFYCCKNKLFIAYFSNIYMGALWVNCRKANFQHFVIAYNNSYRILNRLPMRCSGGSTIPAATWRERDRWESPGYGGSTIPAATWWKRDREEGPRYGGSTIPAATWWKRDRGKGPGYGGSTIPAATWRKRDRGEGPGYGGPQYHQPPGGKET